MVRGAEGARLNEGHLRREHIGDGIDARHVQGFIDGHGRQDGGQRARQQGLARAGRPDHEQVVPAGRGHFQSALDVLLTFDFLEIR